MKQQPTNRWQWAARVLGLVVAIMVLWWLLFAAKDNHVGIEVDQTINTTPEQIQSIRAVGQWEFLSISDEELVDTVRKSLFRTDQLARIYYGTMRLGVDMSRVSIRSQGDTVSVDLPRIDLLDYDFIDEARTKAFYETGTWTAADREALYQKARHQMLAHGLTPANRRTAEQNADAQIRRLLKSMGYHQVTIRWND